MKSVLISILLLSSVAGAMPLDGNLRAGKTIVKNASFRPGWRRYPPADVLIRHWVTMYPVVSQTPMGYDSCYGLNEENRGFLGVDNPLIGLPGQPEPGVAFIAWQYSCLKSATTRLYYDVVSYQSAGTPYPVPSIEEWMNAFPAPVPTESLNKRWSQLNAKQKRDVVARLFETKIGPFEIYEETIAGFERESFLDRMLIELEKATDSKKGTTINSILDLSADDDALRTYFFALGLFELEDFYLY